MKKFILPAAVLLLLAVVIGVFAIRGTAAEKPISVGFAEINVMPQEEGLPIGGYGNTTERLSDSSLTTDEWDMLKATCIAITDGQGNTVLFIGLDNLRAQEILVAAARRKIHWATGVPEDHIMLNVTHTHSAPDLGVNTVKIQNYLNYLCEQLQTLCIEALADREEVTEMQGGSIETEGLNFVRHYTYTKYGQTQYFGNNFGTHVYNSTTKPVTDPDRALHVLRFDRKNGKDPVLMVNFRMHPQLQGKADNLKLTADVIGTFRYAMKNLGYPCVSYYQGSAGMINATGSLDSEQEYAGDWIGYGQKLAEYAQNCPLVTLPTGDVRVVTCSFTGNTNRDKTENYAKAKDLVDIWTDKSQGTIEERRKKVESQGKPYGIRSPYHANSIVARYAYPDNLDMTLTAVTIGNSVEISAVPFEMFHETSLWLENQMKTAGGYKMSMSFGYTNGHEGYVPANTVWAYTSYETDITRWAAGTAEDVAYTICEMLNVPYTKNCP